MFGFGANKPANQSPASSSNNPFDSHDETNVKRIGERTSSEHALNVPNGNSHDRYKNDFRDSGGLENRSVQELENYAVYKAEETTNTVNNCLRIAEDIRQDATKTLGMLQAQGEQIERTHMMAADMDKDLSKGEKLLNTLGGMFSKTWKPKKSREITGPVITSENNTYKINEKRKDKREKLGLEKPAVRSASATSPPELSNAMQKVEVEKTKQDEVLSDLSNILGDLKSMAVDMGTELDRQDKALDHLSGDVDELNSRVKGANQRTRRLLGK